jgi:hypothetical protein
MGHLPVNRKKGEREVACNLLFVGFTGRFVKLTISTD